MSRIKKVATNHWVGPDEGGYTPHFSITQHGIDNYPNGSFLQQEPLQPGNKPINLVYKNKDAENMGEFFEAFSAGGHENYLDMRVDSVHNRRTIMALIWLIVFIWGSMSLLFNFEDHTLDVLALCSLVPICCFGLYKTIAMPVRFHKKNQEVYVYHKEVLYRIPWAECEMSVVVAKSHVGYGRFDDGYQLMLWLNPKHAVNRDLTGERYRSLNLVFNMEHHTRVYGYWEYVRRYMMSVEPLWIKMDTQSRTLRPNRELAKENGESYTLAVLYFILALPLGFLLTPSAFVLWSAPFRDKWPEEVHKWTGERCDWH